MRPARSRTLNRTRLHPRVSSARSLESENRYVVQALSTGEVDVWDVYALIN